MSCNICFEEFNKTNHKQITCDFCNFDSCKTCCEKFILESNQQPYCMNCKREWSRKILVNKFPQKFIDNELKKHQENILFDTEKALLPNTQIEIEHLLAQKKIADEINKHIDEMSNIHLKIESLRLELKNIQHNKERSVFVKKCTNNDCRGFLSSQWKCGICNHWTCQDCHEIKGTSKDSPHTCKQENVDTVKLLNKDSKQCPKCNIHIYKIDGCNQMFCTQCHTAFDWKTGKLETKIHNPHYFEWLKQSGNLERNPLDIQCGREIDERFIISLIKQNADYKFVDISRRILHIFSVDLPRFSTDRINGNQDLRIQYLRNEIDEIKFKSMIQRRNKQFNKNREITNVLSMFVNSITDIIYRYLDNYKKTGLNLISEYMLEIDNLKEYVNNNLEDISSIYKCKTYKINNKFELV